MPKVSTAHRVARRGQILDAAMECFALEGFHCTSMQDIVTASGLSPGAIYRYFASKEAIIEAIAQERHGNETRLLRDSLDTTDTTDTTDTKDAFHRLAHAYLTMLDDPVEQQRRRVGVQVWAEALRSPTVQGIVRRGVDQRHLIVEFLRQAQAGGELTTRVDADGLSRIIVGLFLGIILQQAWEPDLDIQRCIDAVEVLVDGLFALDDKAS